MDLRLSTPAGELTRACLLYTSNTFFQAVEKGKTFSDG